MYPALAVLQTLDKADVQTLWVGGADGMEADLVSRAGVPFESIPAAGLHGVGLRRVPGNLWRLGGGLWAVRRILQRFRPDVLFFTGGYVAMPVALAARSIHPRPRVVLYVPDIEPALALKTLARFADHIALTTETSRQYFSATAPTTVTGYPIRPELTGWERPAARAHFGLSEDAPALLVFGGSLGARSINLAVQQHLPAILPAMQVLHITGQRDWEMMQAGMHTLPTDMQARYHMYPYLHGKEMGAALRAADLVLSRAGASSIGEFPYFGLPAILVPYPNAWRYQHVNATYLEQRGAACLLADAHLKNHLKDLVLELVRAPETLAAMRSAMQRLALPKAAENIGQLLIRPPSGQGATHYG